MSSDRSAVPGLPLPQGLGEDPFLHYTKLYLSFLQGLFSQLPTGNFRWSESENDTEIVISDQCPLPRDRVEQRPAVVVIRGPAQFANLSLDNVREVDWRTGEKVYSDLVSCTMTINCLAKFGPEAQRIAWIVLRHLKALKNLLHKGGIHRVDDRANIGPETPPGALVEPEADHEITNVTVSSPFYFQWVERVIPADAPVAEAIEAHMRTATLPPEAETTKRWEEDVKLKQPTLRGKPVQGETVSLDNPVTRTIKT